MALNTQLPIVPAVVPHGCKNWSVTWKEEHRLMRWIRHVTRTRKNKNSHGVFVWQPEWQKPIGKPRRRRDNIKLNLKEYGLESVDWKDMVRVVVNMVMNLWVHWNAWNFLRSWGTVDFSEMTTLHRVSHQLRVLELVLMLLAYRNGRAVGNIASLAWFRVFAAL